MAKRAIPQIAFDMMLGYDGFKGKSVPVSPVCYNYQISLLANNRQHFAIPLNVQYIRLICLNNVYYNFLGNAKLIDNANDGTATTLKPPWLTEWLYCQNYDSVSLISDVDTTVHISLSQ